MKVLLTCQLGVGLYLQRRLFKEMEANVKAKGNVHLGSVFKFDAKTTQKKDEFLDLLTPTSEPEDLLRCRGVMA